MTQVQSPGTVSVPVVAVTPPLAGPKSTTCGDQILACPNESLTFTVAVTPGGHYDSIEWTADSGTPNSGTGGPTFTTSFAQAGSYSVTAACGVSSASLGVEVGNPTCLSATPLCHTSVVPGWLAPEAGSDCTFGATDFSPLVSRDFAYQPCLNCSTSCWNEQITKWNIEIIVILNTVLGKDVTRPYTCDEAKSVKLFYLDAKCMAGDGGQPGATCGEAYKPWGPIQTHELTHADQCCQLAQDNPTWGMVAALYRNYASPYSSAAAAQASFDPQVTTLLSEMLTTLEDEKSDNAPGWEILAYRAEAAAEKALLDEICSELTEDCDACH